MFKPREALEWFEGVCVRVSSVSLLSVMALTTLDVLARKLFDYSLPSLFEFTEDYLMVALVFLSLSHVFTAGGHVRVTIFEKFIPVGLRRPLKLLLDLPALGMFGLIAVLGWNNAARSLQFGEVSSSLLAYPLAPALFLVPLGSALLCLRIVQSMALSAARPGMKAAGPAAGRGPEAGGR